MSTTTYFDIQLPGENNYDWFTKTNRAFSAITEKMVRLQMPSTTTLRWGDITNNRYLEASTLGLKLVGGIDFGTTPGTNFRFPQGDEFPTDPMIGEAFFRTDEEILYVYYDGDWQAVSAASSGGISAAGGLLITDLGTELGSFAVSDGAGGIELVWPGANDSVLTSDNTSDSGWGYKTVLELLSAQLDKGEFVIGTGTGVDTITPGADDSILVTDSGEDTGLKWASLNSLLNTILTVKGQLLARGAANPTAVTAPTGNDMVLISDSTEAGGVRWAQQTELGSLPSTRTRVAADLYLHANYL